MLMCEPGWNGLGTCCMATLILARDALSVSGPCRKRQFLPRISSWS